MTVTRRFRWRSARQFGWHNEVLRVAADVGKTGKVGEVGEGWQAGIRGYRQSPIITKGDQK